jgi:hypothetical protein
VTAADVDAIAAGILERLGLDATAPASARLCELVIDWSTAWDHDRNQADWLHDNVLARGRGHALFAGHKLGKSLFMLWLAAKVATGTLPVAVLYLDYEMTLDDVLERLEDMGYGPGTDLSRLAYWLLPTLPPLNTAAGADRLDELLDDLEGQHPDHELAVIIDTTSRAVEGDENDAGTYQEFYAHAGIRMKRRGVTFARLDHSGKDPAKGQRGSSAKGDDIDLAWKLARTDSGIVLHRHLTRINWAPEQVTFDLRLDPLRYEQVAQAYLAGTAEVAALLDALEVPLDASSRQAQAALKSASEPRRRAVVLDAIRYRKASQ